MRLLALFACLVAAPAFGQGLTTLAPGATGGGKVLASFPLTTSGALIAEDANTVAHVYWNGTALVDTKGNAWTQNGTVPQVTANPFTTTRYGAGPFSAANYYSLGAGADVLDFAGDFTICTVSNAVASGWMPLLNNFTANTAGFDIWQSTGSGFVQLMIDTHGGGGSSRVIGTNLYPVSVFVACVGVNGSSQYVKANLETTVSAATARKVAATSAVAKIGLQGATGSSLTIYEVYATTTPFTEATVVAIQQKVLGHYDGSAPLAVTRATNATYENPAGTIWTVPAGVARITTAGLIVEPARSNVVLASNTISAANAFNVNWVAWPDETVVDVTTAAAAPMGGTWHTITNEAGDTSNVGQAYQTVTTASSTTFVASVWMKKPTGEDTTHAGIHVGCGAGTPSACTCSRSDGGSCTASTVATNYCQALVADLSTTPVRVSAKVTCSGAITSSIVALVPGNYGSSIGITDFTGVQHEISAAAAGPTNLIVTTTAAATRNADVVTFTAPAGTTWETLTNSGTRTGAAASPGTITLPSGTVSNVKVCGKAKSLKDCK